MAKFFKMIPKVKINNPNNRFDQVINYMMQIAAGDYDARLQISENEDDLDTIIFGLRTLQDELEFREKKRIEAEMERERAIRELEEFAYVAAHDLKAPVINLIALADMITKEGGVVDKSKGVFNRMKESIGEMHKTVYALNEIIALKSKMNEEKVLLNFEKLFKELNESVLDPLLNEKDSIEYDFSQCTDIDYSPLQLRSVIEIVLDNAVKYRHPDRALNIDITTSKNDGGVCLTVKDNGLGFDDTKGQDMVTGLFTRLHTHVEGLGVGMYIVKSIVNSHGGKVEISSKPNEGAVFKIHLNRYNDVKSITSRR